MVSNQWFLFRVLGCFGWNIGSYFSLLFGVWLFAVPDMAAAKALGAACGWQSTKSDRLIYRVEKCETRDDIIYVLPDSRASNRVIGMSRRQTIGLPKGRRQIVRRVCSESSKISESHEYQHYSCQKLAEN